MRWIRALVIAVGALAGCASGDVEEHEVPLCGPLETLARLPDTCAPGELDTFSSALSHEVIGHARSALVRVELDDAARVRTVCVEQGPGYGPASARRALAEKLDAIRALPPGPACVAGKRIDLNRYEAKLEEVREREARCHEQTRITRETQPDLSLGRGIILTEFERCMEPVDWILLDAPGSNRPWIYVKPEVPDPPGPPARDTASRCRRTAWGLERRAACIESEGWERLTPPPR